MNKSILGSQNITPSLFSSTFYNVQYKAYKIIELDDDLYIKTKTNNFTNIGKNIYEDDKLFNNEYLYVTNKRKRQYEEDLISENRPESINAILFLFDIRSRLNKLNLNVTDFTSWKPDNKRLAADMLLAFYNRFGHLDLLNFLMSQSIPSSILNMKNTLIPQLKSVTINGINPILLNIQKPDSTTDIIVTKNSLYRDFFNEYENTNISSLFSFKDCRRLLYQEPISLSLYAIELLYEIYDTKNTDEIMTLDSHLVSRHSPKNDSTHLINQFYSTYEYLLFVVFLIRSSENKKIVHCPICHNHSISRTDAVYCSRSCYDAGNSARKIYINKKIKALEQSGIPKMPLSKLPEEYHTKIKSTFMNKFNATQANQYMDRARKQFSKEFYEKQKGNN